MNRTFARGKDPMYPAIYKFYVSIFFMVQRARKAFKENCSITVDSKSLYFYFLCRY